MFFGKCLLLAVQTAPKVCTGLSVLRGSYSKSVVTSGSVRCIKKKSLAIDYASLAIDYANIRTRD